jgi:hypothetical protein
MSVEKVDRTVAVLLAALAGYYLYTRNSLQLLIWVVLGYLVVSHGLLRSIKESSVSLKHTPGLLAGLVVAAVVLYLSTREHFENEKLDKKEDSKEPEPTGKSTPHVDLGTTILHAYRNLSPEQIGGMRRDTKELMELQKELMGTLAEMKPAIEQGAELLGTFSQFFGSGAMSGAPA